MENVRSAFTSPDPSFLPAEWWSWCCRRRDYTIQPSFPIAMLQGQITDQSLRGDPLPLHAHSGLRLVHWVSERARERRSAHATFVCLSMGKERNSSLPLHVPRKTYQLALVICKNTCHTTFIQVLVHIQLLPTFSNGLRSKVMDMAFLLSHTCYICLVAFDVKIGYGQTVGRVPYSSHFVGWSKTTKGPRCFG